MNSDSHRHSHIDDCRIIDINTFEHANGRLTVMENLATSPINIKRVYYLYDLPAGAERGGHSHIVTREFVIPLAGSFDVVVDDGRRTKRVSLNNPSRGLLLPAGIWRTLDNFSSGSICLVLASEKYDESDYVREYEDFKQLTAEKR
ncbi:MAG: FdtA/QdtA family cupin domain-containing protein [Muribaculaceae bacterium]|nr:FdtA/QdtA family cupin domain-containing protein [Muribaculaceae bacterium]